jgi:hypothetical protein
VRLNGRFGVLAIVHPLASPKAFLVRNHRSSHSKGFESVASATCTIAAKGLIAPCSWPPEESQVESYEHQDNANIHCQPFPESVSEEQEIYTDYDGCHRHQLKHDSYLYAHSVRPRFWLGSTKHLINARRSAGGVGLLSSRVGGGCNNEQTRQEEIRQHKPPQFADQQSLAFTRERETHECEAGSSLVVLSRP